MKCGVALLSCVFVSLALTPQAHGQPLDWDRLGVRVQADPSGRRQATKVARVARRALRRAHQHDRSGEHAQAREALATSLAAWPTLRSLCFFGRVLRRSGALTDARDVLLALRDTDHHRGSCEFELGQTFEALADPTEAHEAYRRSSEYHEPGRGRRPARDASTGERRDGTTRSRPPLSAHRRAKRCRARDRGPSGRRARDALEPSLRAGRVEHRGRPGPVCRRAGVADPPTRTCASQLRRAARCRHRVVVALLSHERPAANMGPRIHDRGLARDAERPRPYPQGHRSRLAARLSDL